MFVLVIAAHVVICLLLILLVLIQQGRGGGLIDSFSSAESILGTKTNTFLVKSTSVLAVAFFLTCLSLAFLSLQKGKSLIETSYRPRAEGPAAAVPAKEPTAAVPAPEAPAKPDAAGQPAADAAAEKAPAGTPTPADTPQGPSTVTAGEAKDTNT